MNQDIVISAKAPANKESFKKDEEGYYTVNLGAVNDFNSVKEFYRHKNPESLFADPGPNNENLFYKRLTTGYLIGEANHPEYSKGMNNVEWYARNIKLAVENAAFHIKEIILNPLNKPVPIPDAGRPVRVLGRIKPSGKHGAGLESMLNNPSQNVAFSVRCITDNKVINGYMVKDIIAVITYDWVNAPGIAECNKWSTIQREDLKTPMFVQDNDLTLIKLEPLLSNKEFCKEVEVALENDNEKEFHRDLVKKIKTISRECDDDYLNRW